MRMSRKRGSLSLSVNAIVIIVLAMTLLGLALGFIRNVFKDIGETTGTVQEQVKQQIVEDLRTGDKRLSFSTTRMNIQRGASEVISFGVKNSKNAKDLNFIVYIETLKKDENGKVTSCTRLDTQDGIDPLDLEAVQWECKDAEGNVLDQGITGISFFYDSGPFILSLDEAEVYPITVKAESKASYLVKISIMEDIPPPDTEEGNGIFGEQIPEQDNEVYAAKTFFINVV